MCPNPIFSFSKGTFVFQVAFLRKGERLDKREQWRVRPSNLLNSFSGGKYGEPFFYEKKIIIHSLIYHTLSNHGFLYLARIIQPIPFQNKRANCRKHPRQISHSNDKFSLLHCGENEHLILSLDVPLTSLERFFIFKVNTKVQTMVLPRRQQWVGGISLLNIAKLTLTSNNQKMGKPMWS